MREKGGYYYYVSDEQLDVTDVSGCIKPARALRAEPGCSNDLSDAYKMTTMIFFGHIYWQSVWWDFYWYSTDMGMM